MALRVLNLNLIKIGRFSRNLSAIAVTRNHVSLQGYNKTNHQLLEASVTLNSNVRLKYNDKKGSKAAREVIK